MRHGFLSHPGWPRVPRSLVRPVMGVLAALALVGVPMLTQVQQASAFESWCWDDPVISVNGHQLTTKIGVYGDATQVPSNVKSATVTYYIPGGVPYQLVKLTNTYMHERVTFVASKTRWTPGTPLVVTVVTQFSSTVNYQGQETNAVGSNTPASLSGYLSNGFSTQVTIQ